jgi:hypothetical protein
MKRVRRKQFAYGISSSVQVEFKQKGLSNSMGNMEMVQNLVHTNPMF